MKKDKHVTKVQFLIEKQEGELPCNVFAFFPEVHYYSKLHPAHNDNFSCYAHMGQHSNCHKEYAATCKEASPEQYKDLKAELESIGYNLEIVKRGQSAFDAEVKIRVDLPLLREQKLLLLNIPFNTKEQSEAIEGIINLIDGIQDYAADVLKIDESYIYSK